MLKKILVLLFLCGNVSIIVAKTEKYWIFFKDKPHTTAIAQSDIWLDTPIASHYLSQIEKVAHLEVQSQWLNAVTVYVNETKMAQLKALPFVQEICTVARLSQQEYRHHNQKSVVKTWKFVNEEEKDSKKLTQEDYGITYTQNDLTKITELHKLGFTGKGIRICVMDGGFPHVNTNPNFARLIKKKKIIKTYDFVEKNENVYDEVNQHGSEVLSTIGAYIEKEMIGGAFDAEFLLARTEDARSETRAEEDNWVAGAEWAYKNGAKIITSSLGYTRFDDKSGYEYKDLNGKTSPASRAATLASRRGIIVLVSAGNEGDNGWHYVGTPADADSIFSVGAVDADGWRTSFSSYGPTSDKRIKPDIMSMGGGVAVSKDKKGTDYVDGTSFACPLTAAAVACLLQSNPKATWKQMYDAVVSTADQGFNPDSSHGYGLLDCYRAYCKLNNLPIPATDTLKAISDFPILVKAVYLKKTRSYEAMVCFYVPNTTKIQKVRMSMSDENGTVVTENILTEDTPWRYGRNICAFDKPSLIRLSKILANKKGAGAVLTLYTDDKKVGSYTFKDN